MDTDTDTVFLNALVNSIYDNKNDNLLLIDKSFEHHDTCNYIQLVFSNTLLTYNYCFSFNNYENLKILDIVQHINDVFTGVNKFYDVVKLKLNTTIKSKQNVDNLNTLTMIFNYKNQKYDISYNYEDCPFGEIRSNNDDLIVTTTSLEDLEQKLKIYFPDIYIE